MSRVANILFMVQPPQGVNNKSNNSTQSTDQQGMTFAQKIRKRKSGTPIECHVSNENHYPNEFPFMLQAKTLKE